MMVTKTQEVQALEAERPRAAQSVPSGRASRAEWLKERTVQRALFVAGDAAALAASHMGAAGAAEYWLGIPGANLNSHGDWLSDLPFLLAVLYLLDRHHSPDVRRPEKELELAVKGVSLAFLLLACANFAAFQAGSSRWLLAAWYPLAVMAVLAMRFGLRICCAALWQRGVGQKRTLLVGSIQRLSELQALLSIQRYRGYELAGIVPLGGETPPGRSSPANRAEGDRWRQAAGESGAEQVIVALDQHTPESHRLISDILTGCVAHGIDVQVNSDFLGSRNLHYEMDESSGFFRFYAVAPWSMRAQRIAKMALERVAGLAGSAVALLLVPVVALLLKMEDGGPVFYRREFVGCDGGVHFYLKFRTMRLDADDVLAQDPLLKAEFGLKHKLAQDPRVLRSGHFLRKYSIDELPQFFSLLRGELALVGPRVISREEARRYGAYLPRLLSVQPGITGFWQVMGRQLTTYEERIQMDMFYIDRWSIWLDLWIVAKTFWKVLTAEGAY